MFRMLAGALILAVLAVATPEEVSTVRYNGGSESPVAQRRRPENDTVNVGTEKPLSHREIRTMPAPWAADMFYRALANFTVHEDVGTAACRKQTQMYLRHLKNNTFWAVKMYDSWSKFPNGLLVGTTHQMGVYEECISVHRPVQGKYCMTEVKLTGSNFDIKRHDEMESHDHAWNEILGFIDYGDRFRRNEVKIGICIPESCSAANLETSLQNDLDAVFSPHHVQAQVKVEPIMCSTDKNSRPYDTGYYITSTLMYLVFLICGLSTLIHLLVIIQKKDMNKKVKMPEFVFWFSFIHNGRSLIKYNKNNDLNIYNGFKTVIMFLMLLGHKYLNYMRVPLMYPKRSETMYEIGPDVFLTSMNLVDPYFFMAGLMIYIMLKPQLIKRGGGFIQIPIIFLYKYIRFIPAYGATMLITAFIIPYMHSGPFWASNTWKEADRCRNYWWANLLAVSNFINVDNQCLIVGWYISCLLQFLIIGIVLVYIYIKKPKFGVGLIVALLIVSLVIPFVLTYVTRSYGLVRVFIPFLQNPNTSYEYNNLYRPFYIRGIPFYAGLLTGIITEELKRREFKLSMLVVYVWLIIINIMSYSIQVYGSLFYNRHRPYNVIEQSTYAVLSHCTWSIGLFWITVCHFTSGFGPITRIFDNRFASLLGRLTYVVYLVNMPVMFTVVSRQTTAVSSNGDIWIDIWILGVVRTYITGLVLHLCIEAPFNEIIKTIFFGNKNNSDQKENTERRNSKIVNSLNVSRL